MQKILWLFLSLAVILEARENPFETSMSPRVMGKATQLQQERTNFNNTTLTLPSSARILKSVTVSFQNLDGSISEEIVAIDQYVDWHYPLVLNSQTTDTKAPIPIALPVHVNESKKLIASKEFEVKIEKQIELKTENNVVEKSGSTFKLSDDLSFFIHQNEITIFTKDSKIRDFLIADPYKIVLDFKKENSFATKTLNFQKAPFLSVILGSHGGFYRTAILLDGHYRYDLQAFNGGYIIKLK